MGTPMTALLLILLALSTRDSILTTASPPTPRTPSTQVSTPTMALHRIPSPLSTLDSTHTTVWPPIPSPLSTPDSTPTTGSLPTPSTPFTTLMVERKSKPAPYLDLKQPSRYQWT